MKTYIQEGDVIEVTAPYDVVSGAGCLVGNALFGVATHTALSGAVVRIATEGVVTLPKATGALTAGNRVFWDNSAKDVTATATANLPIGVVVASQASGDATCKVHLGGRPIAGT